MGMLPRKISSLGVQKCDFQRFGDAASINELKSDTSFRHAHARQRLRLYFSSTPPAVETTPNIFGVLHMDVHECQGQQPFLTHACPVICYSRLKVLASIRFIFAGRRRDCGAYIEEHIDIIWKL